MKNLYFLLYLLVLANPLIATTNLSDSPENADGFTQEAQTPTSRARKDWNFMVYMAANNNLHTFGITNLMQMINVGSTPNINILVQLDEYGKREVNRYYIEKNNPITVATADHTQASTSGTKQSLYEFMKWSIQKFPANNQAIVLWNHGSGIKDPHIWGRALMKNRDQLFAFNDKTGLLELNRHIARDHLDKYEEEQRFIIQAQDILKKRGIAFNDTYEEYLTNQDLTMVLEKVANDLLGKKIDILFMDACHMAMVEIGSQVKSAVSYMAASEEVEPGSGYDYTALLEPFTRDTLSAQDFACQAVKAYARTYTGINADFTQSAINLAGFEKLEQNIKDMGLLMTNLIDNEPSFDFKGLLQAMRKSRRYTTSFCDYDYIDFCHFYKSLSQVITTQLPNANGTAAEKLNQIRTLALKGLNMMQNYILLNASGVNLPNAYGLSFYFPSRRMDDTYFKTIFDQTTNWSQVLRRYLR
ncbi:hypothetical protein K2W90_01945 [Candidatus Babeliales bacterium]|nr:hypothetical protein [Candidatus Babeliales bacterium]